MAAFYDIEKLALELIVFRLQETSIVQQFIGEYPNIDTYIGDALENVADAYAESFHNIYHAHFYAHLDPEQFVQKAILICQKLSTNPDPLHLLLACTFVTECANRPVELFRCFQATFQAWKCLTVFLNRKLGNVHEDQTKWHEFVSCIRRLNQRVAMRPLEQSILQAICQDIDTQQRIRELLIDCDIIEEELDLTPEEIEYLAVEDIIEQERENFVNVPVCEFCNRECIILVHVCLVKRAIDFQANYSILHH